MKQLKYFLLLSAILLATNSYAQNIGIGTTTPDSSAILDIKSTSKGFLMPRMTFAQRNAIISPVEGLMIFQIDSIKGVYVYLNNSWVGQEYNSLPQIQYYSKRDTFFYTGSVQTYVVPAGVTSLHIRIEGAVGGNAHTLFRSTCSSSQSFPAGGFGGNADIVEGDITVTPGDNLYINVGQNGASPTQTSITNVGSILSGGWPNGSSSSASTFESVFSHYEYSGFPTYNTYYCYNHTNRQGGSGGGSSNIRIGSNTQANTIFEAKGGIGGSSSGTYTSIGGEGGGNTISSNAIASNIVVNVSGNSGVGKTIIAFSIPIKNTLDYASDSVQVPNASSASTDNLGNHSATKNIALNNNFISNDGSSNGILLNNNGDAAIGGVLNSASKLNITSANTGSGTANWIAASAGGIAGGKVVMGTFNGNATIGAHNSALANWSSLVLNPGGVVNMPSLASVYKNFLMVEPNGDFSISTPNFAGAASTGLLTTTDWNTFNGKQNALSNANATTNGILTSADWNNFNSKSSFNLPSLTRGAMLFSNGSTLSQDASKLYWNDSTKHFGVGTNFPANTLTVNSTNNGTGTIDWIAGDFGGINGDRVVMGILEGEASIGAHNNSLNGWATLTVNPGGFVKIPSIINYWSSDNQMVTINQQGILGSQPMFQLPTLSTGSVLFSNGVSISQANSKLFWNNATNYLGIGTNNPNRTLTVSSTNNGTGTADWISGNFGAQSGDRVVIGTINSEATIGAHNEQLNSWDTLSLNGGATVKIPNLAGSGTRLVTADNAGHLSTIATVGNASAATTGYLTNTDWNRFNAAAIDTRKIDSGYNGLTKTNQQLTLGGNLIQQTNINMQSNDFIMQSGGGSSILAMNSSLNIGGGTEPAGYGIGQTFTASNTGTINYIKLYGYEIISYTYYLIQGNGLGGTVLATGSGNAYHTTPDAAYFNVSVNVPCIVGQQYTLLITTNGNLGLAYSSIAGNPKQYGDINYPSTWSSNPNQAIFFEVYETPSINTALAISGTNGSIRFGTLGNTNSANYLSTSSNGTVESKTFANASASSNGILTSNDWNTFNNKQNTLSNANSTTSGILTSTDWNTFNNKGSFDLPSLTSGSLLFSNGTTIAENNSKVYWDNTNNRLGVGTNTPSATTEISGTSGLKISSTNPGSGTSDWIASNVGGTSGDRVVSGVLDGNATIGAHNNSLNAWSNLVINNTGAAGATVTIGNNANTSPTIAAATTQTNSTQLNTKLVVNGSVRQGYYSTPISVAANSVTYVTWNHNLGYGPIVMMSTDQNGGGGYMDYCNVTTYNNNANQTIFVIRNLGGSNATGNLRWVLVW